MAPKMSLRNIIQYLWLGSVFYIQFLIVGFCFEGLVLIHSDFMQSLPVMFCFVFIKL